MKSQPANDFWFTDRSWYTRRFFQQVIHVIRRRARKLIGVFPAINYFRSTRETTFHRRYRRSKLSRCDDERVVHLRFFFDSSHGGGPKVSRAGITSRHARNNIALSIEVSIRFNDTFLRLPPRRLVRKVERSLRAEMRPRSRLFRESYCAMIARFWKHRASQSIVFTMLIYYRRYT